MQPSVIQIAMVCHEANRAYCASHGDMSQQPWEFAPAWQQESAINGVVAHLDNRTLTPAESHECWMKAKLDDGWKFGPTKDAEKKEHPCMRPYTELPAEQQVKDSIFRAIVLAMSGGDIADLNTVGDEPTAEQRAELEEVMSAIEYVKSRGYSDFVAMNIVGKFGARAILNQIPDVSVTVYDSSQPPAIPQEDQAELAALSGSGGLAAQVTYQDAVHTEPEPAPQQYTEEAHDADPATENVSGETQSA